jgi:hypothetical protein
LGSASPEVDERRAYDELLQIAGSRSTGVPSVIKYFPVALVFAAIGILLYLSVGGVNLDGDIPYIIVAYAIGALGLALAYGNVATWVNKQRAIQKVAVTGEAPWFSLFYNNAFYVFLLFLGSHLLFSTLTPATSLVLTQALAALLPAWMSTLSK